MPIFHRALFVNQLHDDHTSNTRKLPNHFVFSLLIFLKWFDRNRNGITNAREWHTGINNNMRSAYSTNYFTQIQANCNLETFKIYSLAHYRKLYELINIYAHWKAEQYIFILFIVEMCLFAYSSSSLSLVSRSSALLASAQRNFF